MSYVPHFNRVEDEAEIREFVRDRSVATLITAGADGVPDATLLPIVWDGDEAIAHVARANDHWRRIADGAAGLFVVQGVDGYVSPGWYASKREHGKVVPTWNYSAVHLRGPVTVHDDADWKRAAVSRLTAVHEASRQQPWAVTDAPEQYVEGQLRAIVGISMRVETVDAKAKWSQKRSDEDRAGVVAGMRADGAVDAADHTQTGRL
ncbi:FMN-binding negative transcriptional regulator [Calidifontibacter sp. DB0510]|uniref:FMN-binding negative transcriptional regulator n=1 Tax=Metallococcus carri TaxID=1656884 RepID=A0A967AYD0_9MICO|nr:FMN-binding negative transcriptional regulator [Metallococcus carri]NHN55281.1 FMN-binding negative transcriptional regulator [Metallococcus carri]NOP36358.1 FMN-binding negative transcriptional regulator [Calidifontibacter sp. DB2511S]